MSTDDFALVAKQKILMLQTQLEEVSDKLERLNEERMEERAKFNLPWRQIQKKDITIVRGGSGKLFDGKKFFADAQEQVK